MSKKILIVEDNFETIDILKKRLADRGYVVTLATTGEEAMEAAKIVKPDLFILDIMLSGDLTGIDLLKFLRKEKHLKDKPVVILTNLDSERDEAMKYNVSEYLVKSNITLGEIVKVAKNIFKKCDTLLQMSKVLIVDDEPEFMSMISAKLKKEGIDSVGYENSKQGLAYLNENKDKVSLVVLDLLMPEMSGWVFLTELAKNGIKNIPVIVLTNLSTTELPDDLDLDTEMLIKTDISMKQLVAKIQGKIRY